MEDKIPDNVVPNANILPYGSNLSAPAIKTDLHKVAGWKLAAVHNTNKYYDDKFNDIKKQLESLAESYKWNEIIFNAQFRFKPVIGKSYYLYKKPNESFYLTLFAPGERAGSRDEGYQGEFRLNYDNRWEQVTDTG